jgi:hypothetical protein
MPKLTHGWLEIYKDEEWIGVVKIDSLTTVAPEVTAKLFDVDNLEAVKPIADRRGMPKGVSFEVETQREFWREGFSDTWITLDEIRSAFEIKTVKEGWAAIFYIMETLGAVYSEDRVRLVVWFS